MSLTERIPNTDDPTEIQPWEIMQQTRWWFTKGEGWVRVKEMSLGHKRNLARWLIRRPRILVAIHAGAANRAGLEAMGAAASMQGEMALDSMDRIIDQLSNAYSERAVLWREGEAACTEWLVQTPLYRRLQRDIAGEENNE